METTLVLVKPDGVQRGLVGEVIARLEKKGLALVGLKLLRVSRALAERHYAEHRQKPFYPGLVEFITAGPVVALAVRGPRAIQVVRDLMGKTFGHQAAPGTIRGDFSASTAFNIVHGSDSAASAARELDLFFAAGEILDFEPALARWCHGAEDLV
ncbi:MAG: nucleoside-diphosphate kinase [Planctomycetes bacterium]|nr:nucleoside-diphosphate kinase [Planctomycetota bacterium]